MGDVVVPTIDDIAIPSPFRPLDKETSFTVLNSVSKTESWTARAGTIIVASYVIEEKEEGYHQLFIEDNGSLYYSGPTVIDIWHKVTLGDGTVKEGAKVTISVGAGTPDTPFTIPSVKWESYDDLLKGKFSATIEILAYSAASAGSDVIVKSKASTRGIVYA